MNLADAVTHDEGKKGSLSAPHDYDSEVLRVLKEVFGHSNFREGQLAMIRAQLDGKNVLATAKTGNGKSLGFQLPAVIEHERTGAVTVVVSPLIALMKDQIEALNAKGVTAVTINSLMPDAEQKAARLKILRGEVPPLLYVAPETLCGPLMLRLLKKVNVARVVVDEAHCISTWGHDFRPSYQRISQVCAELNNPPVTAVTATAPSIVREDIRTMLGVEEFVELHSSIDRPELKFVVEHYSYEGEKDQALLKICAKQAVLGHPTIIYCSRIANVEAIEKSLQEMGLPVVIYHGQMERDARIASQEAFMNNTALFMVATKAFGMGIDKQDIRTIIHSDVPDSLEGYFQEAGRAGRDGQEANCILLFTPMSIRTQQHFLFSANPSRATIMDVYERLRKFIKRDQAEETTPTIKFYERRFLERLAIYYGDKFAQQAAVSLAILEESGVIYRLGADMTFLYYKGEDWRGEFPITQQDLSLKFQRDFERLKIMIYYATQSGRDPREVILEHFESNGVASKVENIEPIEMVNINQADLVKVCHAAALHDRERSYLAGFLSGKQSGHGELYGALSHLQYGEVAFLINYAEALKLIRFVPLGGKSYVNATQQGVQALYRDGIELREGEASSYADLKPHLLRDGAKNHIRESFEPWFSRQLEHTRPDRWPEVLGYFLESKVTILDSLVPVSELVRDYFHLSSQSLVSISHLAELFKIVYGSDDRLPKYLKETSLVDIERAAKIAEDERKSKAWERARRFGN